jgi:hypothetical protein
MTSNARPGPRILGSLRAADGKGVVHIEDRYDTDIDDLWSALTDPTRLVRCLGLPGAIPRRSARPAASYSEARSRNPRKIA